MKRSVSFLRPSPPYRVRVHPSSRADDAHSFRRCRRRRQRRTLRRGLLVISVGRRGRSCGATSPRTPTGPAPTAAPSRTAGPHLMEVLDFMRASTPFRADHNFVSFTQTGPTTAASGLVMQNLGRQSSLCQYRIALQAAAEGVPITIVYPGVIYGPGKLTTGNLVSRILIERFNGRLPGYIGDGYDMSMMLLVGT